MQEVVAVDEDVEVQAVAVKVVVVVVASADVDVDAKDSTKMNDCIAQCPFYFGLLDKNKLVCYLLYFTRVKEKESISLKENNQYIHTKRPVYLLVEV